MPPQHFRTLHQWCVKFLSTISRFFTRFGVENTESEFSVVGRLKRVKKPQEKLSTPLVQNSEGKYSLQVKIFEFYPSGPKCRGALCGVQSATPALLNFTPVVLEVSLHDFLPVNRKYRIRIFGRRAAQTGKRCWKETLRTTGAKF